MYSASLLAGLLDALLTPGRRLRRTVHRVAYYYVVTKVCMCVALTWCCWPSDLATIPRSSQRRRDSSCKAAAICACIPFYKHFFVLSNDYLMEQRQQQQRFPSPVGNTRCVTDHRTPAVQWEAAADYVYNHNHRRNAQEGREKMLGGSNSCRSFPIGMGRKMTMVAHRYIETQQLLRPKCSAGRFDPNQLSMHQIIFNVISAYILVFFCLSLYQSVGVGFGGRVGTKLVASPAGIMFFWLDWPGRRTRRGSARFCLFFSFCDFQTKSRGEGVPTAQAEKKP